jgi:hypothetical protein
VSKFDSLGLQLAAYSRSTFRKRDLALFWLPGLALILLPLAIGVDNFYYGYTQYGPAAADSWSSPWLIAALAAAAGFLLLVIRRLWRGCTSVRLHERGLLIRGCLGQRRRILFQEFDGISVDPVQPRFLFWKMDRTLDIRLYRSNRSLIRLPDHLNQSADLAERIKSAIYPEVERSLQAGFVSGNLLHFGPISLDKDGINYSGNTIPWSALDQVDIQKGQLIIQSHDSTGKPQLGRISARRVSNLEIMLQFIHVGVNS